MMKNSSIDYSTLDKEIIPAVKLLNKHGLITFESCQGGDGHCFTEPIVRFFGDEFDLIRAFEICTNYNLCVFEARRVYRKTDLWDEDNRQYKGLSWDKPCNEIVFFKNSITGTIFHPH